MASSTLSHEPLLLADQLGVTSSRLLQEPGERRLPGVAIKRMSAARIAASIIA